MSNCSTLRPLGLSDSFKCRADFRCSVRNSPNKKVFLRTTTVSRESYQEAFAEEMYYPDFNCTRNCDPLLIPISGPTKFWFNVDLHHIKRFTMKRQYTMTIIEGELTKLAARGFVPCLIYIMGIGSSRWIKSLKIFNSLSHPMVYILRQGSYYGQIMQ